MAERWHRALLMMRRRGMQEEDGAELFQELVCYFLFSLECSYKGCRFQIIYGLRPFPQNKTLKMSIELPKKLETKR
jgi:hypothetical protein